jgi:hypothetical protein
MFAGGDPSDQPPSNVNLLRCAACGKTQECTPTDALKCSRSHSPRCCGEVMALYVESLKSGEIPRGNGMP